MGNITINIISGTPPFTVETIPYVEPTYIFNTLGIHVLYDIPAGEYAVKITDANGCEVIKGGIIIIPPVEECDVFFITGNDGSGDYNVYSYSPLTKTSTFRFNHGFSSGDIANTDTRLWIPNRDTDVIKEYIITLDPFTITFNRDLTIAAGFYYSPGLGVSYANDVSNKYTLVGFDFNTYKVKSVTFDNSTVGVVADLFSISPRFILGDIIYDPDNDYYTLASEHFTTHDKFITTYDSVGNKIFEIETTGVADVIYGLFVFEDELYACDNLSPDSKIYKVNYDSLTLFDTISGLQIQGASQALSCGVFYPTTTTSTTETTTTTTPTP